MKSISISNSLFAALWARATEDDSTEEDILRRLLSVPSPEPHREPKSSKQAGGLLDTRSGVTFPEGFKVFRNYKGTRYEAVVQDGQWYLSGNDEPIKSLNALSAAIGATTESAWNGWRFERDGEVHPVNVLREEAGL
jgi:hypothetical protein